MKTLTSLFPLPQLFVVVTCILLYCPRLSANDPAHEYQEANNLFQNQNYDDAAKVYEGLLAQEYRLSEVYYNLGNCYYKTGHTGRAILNYERALKYAPDDEDILFNLRMAQLKTVDKIEHLPEIFYVRWLRRATSVLSTDGWGIAILTFTWLTFLSLAFFLLFTGSLIRKTFLISAFALLILTLTSWFFSQQSYHSNIKDKNGVVMSSSAYVKSAPGDNNTDIFILHEGAEARILDEYDGWIKIRIANGNEGWIKQGEVEII